MNRTPTLHSSEIVPGRPFTHPDHARTDLALMQEMAHHLIAYYTDPAVCDFKPGQRPVCKVDTQERFFRIYYVQAQLLFTQPDLTVVGFFGQKRANADIKPLLEADRRFEKTFHSHPGLLSLSTVRLPNGDFANLVLFTDDEAKEVWNRSPLHKELAAQVSPPYYHSVRLNNGRLPRGLAAPDELFLERTRYIDYDTDPPWRALREL